MALTSKYSLATSAKLGLTHIPQVMEYDNALAPYTKLMARLKDDIKLEFESIYLPSSRANRLLLERKIDCVFPILAPDNRPIATILSTPVNGINAHIFSVKGKTYYKLHELKGKSVVYLRGYLFGDLLERVRDVNFLAVNSQVAAHAMLKKNRADAYLEYIPDIKYSLTTQQLAELSYSEKDPVITANDRLECITSEQGRALLKQFDKAILKLQKSGEIKTILGKYYVETTN